MIKNILTIMMFTLALATSAQTFAKYSDVDKKHMVMSEKMKNLKKKLSIPPAAGLFGVYGLPKKGQFVIGVNYQRYEFSGLLKGSNSISAQQTALEAPNQFFGKPLQPATLRVVPKKSKADVILPFINYTISDKVSLVALVPLTKKQATLETFSGANPNVSLGTNTVESKGLGDIKLGALYKLHDSDKHHVLVDMVLSLPTGSIKKEDIALTPANTMQSARLGYGLQLGSGTLDALLGVSYWGKDKRWGWGAQYLATIPLEDKNSEGWRYDDKHEATVWGSYAWKPSLVSSLRLRTEHQGKIKGVDSNIYGPGLGAQTSNYGGNLTEASIGMNWTYARAKNISIEYAVPISQNRNGYQAERDSTISISWRNAFF
ncbi:conserved hypothetical protein [endosymbiont of Bathymodiolus septemdierum str. Myojin knoll]|uniref:Uncharacterized protein n=2 Tax=sulfur-oxidizing symbionts TaxID=32036 RepID=A0A0P0UTC2_9GAMM|nr:conserved hypothetical protein [endosymbiont of Bathymodiolus septemdierum str. Myojin knoll]